jgi:hypothetical protein
VNVIRAFRRLIVQPVLVVLAVAGCGDGDPIFEGQVTLLACD